MKAAEIFSRALELVSGPRRAKYGPPRDNFGATADVWTGLLRYKLRPGVRLEAGDVALLMVGLKLCREVHTRQADNLVDAAGYLAAYVAALEAPEGEPVGRSVLPWGPG